jgi:hypothetical protein
MPDYSGDLAVYTGGEGTATQVLTSNGPGVAPNWEDNFDLSVYAGGEGTATQVLTSNGAGVAPTWQDAAGGIPQWLCETNYVTSTVKYGTDATYSPLMPSNNDYEGDFCEVDFTAANHGVGTYEVDFEALFFVNNDSGNTVTLDYSYSADSAGTGSNANAPLASFSVFCSSSNPTTGNWTGVNLLRYGEAGLDGSAEYTTNNGLIWTGPAAVNPNNCQTVVGTTPVYLEKVFAVRWHGLVRLGTGEGFNPVAGITFRRFTGNANDYAKMTRSILHVTKISSRD